MIPHHHVSESVASTAISRLLCGRPAGRPSPLLKSKPKVIRVRHAGCRLRVQPARPWWAEHGWVGQELSGNRVNSRINHSDDKPTACYLSGTGFHGTGGTRLKENQKHTAHIPRLVKQNTPALPKIIGCYSRASFSRALTPDQLLRLQSHTVVHHTAPILSRAAASRRPWTTPVVHNTAKEISRCFAGNMIKHRHHWNPKTAAT